MKRALFLHVIFLTFAIFLFQASNSEAASNVRSGLGTYYVDGCGAAVGTQRDGWYINTVRPDSFTNDFSDSGCQRYKDRDGLPIVDIKNTGMSIRSPDATVCNTITSGYATGQYICAIDGGSGNPSTSAGVQGGLFFSPGGASTGRYVGTFAAHWGFRSNPPGQTGDRDWRIGAVSYSSDDVNQVSPTTSDRTNGSLSNVQRYGSGAGYGGEDSTPNWNGSCWNQTGAPQQYANSDSCYFGTTSTTEYAKKKGALGGRGDSQIGQGSAAHVNTIGIKMACNPLNASYCSSTQRSTERATEYAVRMNVYKSRGQIEDEVGPNQGAAGGDFGTEGATIAGTQNLGTYNATDASNGIWYMRAYVTSGGAGSAASSLDTGEYGRVGTWGGANCQFGNNGGEVRANNQQVSSSMFPCASSKNMPTQSWDSTSLSNGYHTVVRYAVDPAQNRIDNSYNVYVDNTPPGGGSNPTCGAGGITFNGENTTPGSSQNAYDESGKGRWRKNTISVSACAGDEDSGVSGARIDYRSNGGGWTSATCPATSTTQYQRGQTSVTCTLSTTSLTEGTKLEFSSVVADYAGTTVRGPVSGARFVDNTAPDVTNLKFNNKNGDEIATESLSGRKWTNQVRTTATWDVNRKAGAPIRESDFNYAGGPSCSPLATNSNGRNVVNTDGATRSVDVYNTNVTGCDEQGQHKMRVWAVDQLGNSSLNEGLGGKEQRAYTVLASNKAPQPTGWLAANATPYYFDNIAPVTINDPSVAYADPKDATPVNGWSVYWTDPLVTDTTKEAPLVKHYVQFTGKNSGSTYSTPGGAKVGGGIHTVGNASDNCLASEAKCTEENVMIDNSLLGTGSLVTTYIYKVWEEDAAGNQDIGNAADIPLKYRNPNNGCALN